MTIQVIDLGTIAQDGADGDLAREAFIKVNANFQDLEDRKVEEVVGKQLSTEDYTTAEKTKLSGIQAGATANQTDAYLLERANHTGEQSISTITDLATTISQINTDISSKQNTLVAGNNITIDNTDPLAPIISSSGGSAGGSTTWGAIGGTLADQVDLTAALAGKASAAQGELADTAVQPPALTELLDLKVDKIAGYRLSQENFTNAEKTKLAGLDGPLWKGTYVSLAALQSAHPTAEPGSSAHVDAGVGDPVKVYNWDASDGEWVAGGGDAAPVTAAQVKTLYESNPDTNAFTDDEKSKLGGVAAGATANTDTDSLPESATPTNKWFTVARVLATVLTGLSVATGGAVVATDTMLQAVGKLQKQITDLTSAFSETDGQNLLINGDFGINQRAFAGGALAAGAYGHDRWGAYNGGANYTVSSGVVNLASGVICQTIEAPGLAGVTVTVSIDSPSAAVTVHVGSGVNYATGTISSGAGRCQLTLTVPVAVTGHVKLRLSGAASFSRVKMERGAIATAWQDMAQGISRIQCCRYFYAFLNTSGVVFAAKVVQTAGVAGICNFDFPARMRALPAVTASGIRFVTTGGTATTTDAAILTGQYTPGTLSAKVNFDSFVTLPNPSNLVLNTASSHVSFDAELSCTD